MDSRGTDKRGTDKVDEAAISETPEDVAVLYSWANLHGAKYRDFSASRREYRAQLRHRAAEQVREQALLSQAEAEAAATTAENAATQATAAARVDSSQASEAEDAARIAAAERMEAARRAEAAAVAEAAARREEREIAEAHVSAQMQAARYAESEMRRRVVASDRSESSEIPGSIMDPYTPLSNAHAATVAPQLHREAATTMQTPRRTPQNMEPSDRKTEADRLASEDRMAAPAEGSEERPGERRYTGAVPPAPRRPQGYRPDDASGVRQIYRGRDYESASPEYAASDPGRSQVRPGSAVSPFSQEIKPGMDQRVPTAGGYGGYRAPGGQSAPTGQRRTDFNPLSAEKPSTGEPTGSDVSTDMASASEWSIGARPMASPTNPRSASASSSQARPVSPFSQSLAPADPARDRRPHDEFDYQAPRAAEQAMRAVPESPGTGVTASRTPHSGDPAGPAWLYAPSTPSAPQRPLPSPLPPQPSVADTLQHSRERVAARWFALKGVFEQPGHEQEVAPVRQKETRTPVLAVFSLAGGVGKTSLVATVGRSLSSMGEKVLLTDTTSHGLLPFYFGASELRHGAVRTFSPPSGSTDAPIYLVSYGVDQKTADDEAQEQLAEEIINNSRGTHRILLDLTVGSSWIVRRMSRMNPTILVPVAPDMNSVISLQTVEKFFSGVNDGDGRPLQPYYVLNQFDASLPLHLDVREVMRRQLGERLLPFVIRRAPAVSEALAEGMTVVDYAPDAPVAEDYLNLATWLRTVAAPATAGFRNVRWSER